MLCIYIFEVRYMISYKIAIIDHSTLHQKQTSSIHIYPPGIDTDPITHPVRDGHQSLCLVTCTYIS